MILDYLPPIFRSIDERHIEHNGKILDFYLKTPFFCLARKLVLDRQKEGYEAKLRHENRRWCVYIEREDSTWVIR